MIDVMEDYVKRDIAERITWFEFRHSKVQARMFFATPSRPVMDNPIFNKIVKSKAFRMVTVSQACRQGYNFYSKTDAASAYLSFKVDDSIKGYQVVKVGNRLYRFTRMMWGTSFAPAYMSMVSDVVIRYVSLQYPEVVCLAYMDDFLIEGKT